MDNSTQAEINHYRTQLAGFSKKKLINVVVNLTCELVEKTKQIQILKNVKPKEKKKVIKLTD